MLKIQERLDKLGIVLPEASAPVANYAGFIASGGRVFVSGQLPLENGQIKYKGKVGKDLTIEEAKEAAKLCAINILAQMKVACEGDLSRIAVCIKLGVFVNAGPDFTDHPIVANGASDLIASVLGDAVGKHARAAVGCASLPRGAAVEVEAIFQVD